MKKLKVGQPAKTIKIGAGSQGIVAATPVQATVTATASEKEPAVAETDDAVQATVGAAEKVAAGASDAAGKVQEAFNKHLPTIKAKVQEQLSKMGKSASQLDDAAWNLVFGRVHKLLPFPVRVVLKKKKFIALCKQHKDKFV